MASHVLNGCTEVQSVRLTYNWTIENFKLLHCEYGDLFESPIFSTKDKKVEWCLQLYPAGSCYDHRHDICLLLHLRSHKLPMSKINTIGNFSIITSDTVLAKGNFNCSLSKSSSVGSHQLISKNKLLENGQSDDSFIICCELEYSLAMTKKPAKREIVYNVENHRLGEDCRHLIKDPNQFSDVTIVVGGKNIPAHKFLLAARSPVLAAMFAHKEFEENKTNEIKIEDLDADVIEGMLEFIYTDQVTNLSELADRLIVAAQKYELQYLRTMCEKSLYQCLNTTNAGDIVVVAGLHGSNEFLDHVIEFIADHFSEVIATSAYDRIQDPELLKKITRAVDCRLH